MGKKRQGSQKKSKNRRRTQSEETSDAVEIEVEGTKKCVHVRKAAKLSVLQSSIPHMKLGECSFCLKSANDDAGVGICLRCGKQGCDRYSEDKHGLSHYESTPSHCLTVSLNSMMVWCYSCDVEVPVKPDTDLHECIKLLLKALRFNAPNDHILHEVTDLAIEGPTKTPEVNNFKFASNSRKIKGLVNLGNTCFFNAVMQNLFQTELLHVAMASVNQPVYSQLITTKNDLPKMSVQVTTPPGSLIIALTKLLHEYRSSSPSPLSPKFLFSEICKKASRFKGFQQQDSQELLRYLLDSVKTEQLRRIKIGVLKSFEIKEGTDAKSLPEKKKQMIKEYVSVVTAPSVDSVFAGRLDSIVVCHECHKESRMTESFLDLSLSLVAPQIFLSVKGKLKAKKDAGVPQRSKNKNTDHPEEPENTGQDGYQTPSKHQKKAAREAKRKKGRKGKKRTLSYSASEDGKLESKQENLTATSDESDNEEHVDLLKDTEVSGDATADQENSSSTNIDRNNLMQYGAEGVISHDQPSGKDVSVEDINRNNLMESGAEGVISQPSGKDVSVEGSSQANTEVIVERELTVKDSGVGESLENDSGIEKNGTKDSGMQQEVAKDSGTEETISEILNENDSIIDLSQRSKNHGVDSEGAMGGTVAGKSGITMEIDVESNLSKEHEEIATSHTTRVIQNEQGVMSSPNMDVSEQIRNNKKEKYTENVEKNSYKITERKENSTSEVHQDSNEDHLDNDSYDRPPRDDSKNMPNYDDEQSDNVEHCEMISDTTTEKNENQLKITGNFDKEKRDIADLPNQSSDMESSVAPENNLESTNNELNNKNKEDQTSGDENIRCSPCGNCVKVDQTCDVKNENCRCSQDGDYDANKTTEVPSSSVNDENTTSSLIREFKKLEVTHKVDNISTEKTKELENENVENNQLQTEPDYSMELQDDYEGKADSGEGDNFLPKVRTLGPAYVSNSTGECSVESSLSLFCSPEILEGKNKFACEECSKRKKEGRQEREEEEGSSTDEDNPKGAAASKPKNKKKSEKPVVYTEATKQMLISYTPPVLTLHFKRFQQVGFGLRKVPKHVNFPLVLDLAPFCRRNGEIYSDSEQQVLYSLIGVVEHSGGLNSGHYTACVKLKSSPTYGIFTDRSHVRDFASFIEGMWKKNQRESTAHAQPRDGQWYHVSDSRVSLVTEARVLKSQAYMLFYERLPFLD